MQKLFGCNFSDLKSKSKSENKLLYMGFILSNPFKFSFLPIFSLTLNPITDIIPSPTSTLTTVEEAALMPESQQEWPSKKHFTMVAHPITEIITMVEAIITTITATIRLSYFWKKLVNVEQPK